MLEIKVIYEKSSTFDEDMKSGLMKEKQGEIKIEAKDVTPILITLNKCFKTSLNTKKASEFDLFIWPPEDESSNDNEIGSFHITVKDNYSFEKSLPLVNQILSRMNDHVGNVRFVKIMRDCEVDPSRVEQFLNNLKNGDVTENILDNISRLCVIDSETYNSNAKIAQMIDEFEEILFAELVNKKIRVNGKGGILKEVNGNYGRYGFFERGVRKNYACLSLVQKMGARTVREIEFLI